MEDYEVEFVERGDREARFLVRGITPAFANGIRRAMVADVPTFSIDELRVVENSSVMFDEQIGLRLGLVPLTTPEGEFEIGDEVTLALDVEGPSREETTETVTAYSGDIVSSDEMVRPANDNIPIIDLKAGQRLEAEADAVLDRGRDHAKHQGGVAVGYRHLQRVEVVGDKGEFADEEPHILRGVVEEDGELVHTDEFGNDLTQRYPGKEIEVEDVPNAFVFHVETDGSLTVDELVTRAVGSLRDRADELRESIQL
ncbi:DNA-directed RNA polymerase subunit D [Halosimplex carlsbadense 2-9-1]|uniref:DNA-directed RNA polymerase subunit Rpo3 n=1 Tax=Halosimplex carlsbadense 2-9-1 TaxID=797114 RepID=M0CUM9_9EURY|nr:DNA-directed RNA polymerase subunit D [Halosimplex carlsbadense]ELZ25579.1 DNA-directed RNA polymerase subunit D [Halosimplex carlsbadense 2-9-1]